MSATNNDIYKDRIIDQTPGHTFRFLTTTVGAGIDERVCIWVFPGFFFKNLNYEVTVHSFYIHNIGSGLSITQIDKGYTNFMIMYTPSSNRVFQAFYSNIDLTITFH